MKVNWVMNMTLNEDKLSMSMTLYEDKLSYEYGYRKINWVKTMTLQEGKLSHEYDSTWK